ncbi:periplasmic solute binding family protein, partial [Chlamydia psittaci 84-8471/1]
ELKR